MTSGRQQKHGRHADWLVASSRTPTWGAEAKVIPGTDQVGVQVKLRAVDAITLGAGGGGMEQPTQIKIDKTAKETYSAREQHAEVG